MALAHTIENKVEAAYSRGGLFEKRRTMITDWASFVSAGGKGKVSGLDLDDLKFK
jgi:hypothetical protein